MGPPSRSNESMKSIENASINKHKNGNQDHGSASQNNVGSLSSQEKMALSSWGLPDGILQHYEKKGINQMFQWQLDCLTTGKVLDGGNLVYSAPTSAGKTLVAEILISQTVLEKQKKVIVILPFVSVVREKMFYFQSMFSSSGVRVEGYMGGHTPSLTFKQVHVAVCTIEKANSLVNKMLEEKTLHNLGLVVVDELHLLGDPYRGYLLELVLTKLKYMSSNIEDINVQIVGMSATLPNLKTLADWLKADLYYTDFRPVPLSENLKCGSMIFNKKMKLMREIIPIQSEVTDDSENVGQLCLETIQNGHSILIFCPTKVWCENLADKIAMFFRRHGCSKDAATENTPGWILRKELNLEKINEVIDHLKMCPVGLDQDLHKTVAFGVAFHHAGLTLDERDIIEGSFRRGNIRVLCATSTLSSGVNLPARRVIIRTPMSFGGVMDVLTYKQMTGRAGRMGVDSEGESILICKPNEKIICQQLMSSSLKPIESCLGHGRLSASLKRAILEIIASGIACTPEDVKKYSDCTFLAHSSKKNIEDPIQSCIQFLEENEFIRLQENGNVYVATPLGQACLASSLPPDEGLSLFRELQRARRCFVLDSDLHIIYQVTPYSVSEQWSKLDWLNVLNVWEELPATLKRVGELVGVQESFLARVVKGTANPEIPENRSKLSIVRRFYTALALQDLVNEIPLTEVARKYDCNKGMLQSLQQSAATYAGMVTEFAKRLGWGTIQLIVSEFQERLQFGIQRELCELMRLPLLNAMRARALYNAGFTSLASLAHANVVDLENALHKVTPFQSKKEIVGETSFEREQRNKLETLWVTGKAGLTVRQAAEELITESRNLLQIELGLEFVKWSNEDFDESINETQNSSRLSYPNMAKIGLNKPVNRSIVDADVSVINNNSINEIYCDNIQNGAMSSTPKAKNSLENNSEILRAKNSSIMDADSSSDKTPIVIVENDKNNTDYFASSFNLDQIPNDLSNRSENIVEDSSDSSLEVIYDSTIKNSIEKSQSVLSCDIFADSKFSTPAPKNLENLIEDSPDIFSQSLTFDTQINRVLDFEIVEASSPDSKPSSSFNSDDAGFVSDLSPPKKSKINPPKESDVDKINDLITESMFANTFETQLNRVNESAKRKINEESPDVIPCSDDSYVEEGHVSKRARMTFLANKAKQIFATPVGNAEESDEEILPTPESCTTFTMRMTRTRFNRSVSQKSILGIRKKGNGKKLELNVTKNGTLKNNESKLANGSEKINNSKIEGKKLNRMPKTINWEKINIVDVCENKASYESFCEELKAQNIVGLALGCRRVEEERRSIIGSKIKRAKSQKQTETKSNCRYNEIILDGIAFYWNDNNVFYFSMDDRSEKLSEKLNFLKEISRDKIFRIFDSKEQIKMLKNCAGIFWGNASYEDPKIASWLLSLTSKEKSFDSIINEYLPQAGKLIQQIGQIPGVSSPGLCIKSLVGSKMRACVEGFLSYHVITRQIVKLKEFKLDKAFKEMEMPIVVNLAEMELNGFQFDRVRLMEIQVELEKLKSDLEEKAYELAKHKFSLASNSAVSKVLYNELELGGDNVALTKKNKKPSTNKDALQELACESRHPLPDIILQWRKIRAILSKVISPLLLIPEKETRVFPTSYMYTVTGRISMHEPNLQNMPRDFKVTLGKELLASVSMRETFIASENCVLLSADYRQIELRLLAHFSQDVGLIHSITSSSDVFVNIASNIYNLPLEKVNDEQRQKAKQTCYGIIYGIGARTLSHNLRIEEKDAVVLLEDFKNKYPGVKSYLDEVVQECRKNGYIKSLSGRRRYLPAINDTNPSIRSEAERQAINTTIQGSAADLAKTAMVEIRKHLKSFIEEGIIMNLVLHLHDELLYEVHKDHVDNVAKILKEAMENVITLTVPTPVKLHSGPSWGRLEVLEL